MLHGLSIEFRCGITSKMAMDIQTQFFHVSKIKLQKKVSEHKDDNQRLLGYGKNNKAEKPNPHIQKEKKMIAK